MEAVNKDERTRGFAMVTFPKIKKRSTTNSGIAIVLLTMIYTGK
jgi:hypothetical protein